MTTESLSIVRFADSTSALYSGVVAMHHGLIRGQWRSKMADEKSQKFEDWKVSELKAFLLARDVHLGDQTKALLIQNCYAAVSLGLHPPPPPKKKTRKSASSLLFGLNKGS